MPLPRLEPVQLEVEVDVELELALEELELESVVETTSEDDSFESFESLDLAENNGSYLGINRMDE